MLEHTPERSHFSVHIVKRNLTIHLTGLSINEPILITDRIDVKLLVARKDILTRVHFENTFEGKVFIKSVEQYKKFYL